MGNSSLVNYTKLSPNHSGKRTHSIDRITPHCVVGQLTAEGIASCFPAGRSASCNYGIGRDGKVALIVDEANRSWCSSSSSNDQRAITIECASGTKEPYEMNDAVYNKLIDLCVDICKRYNKTKLVWISDKTKALSYSPKSNEMQLTVHRWFANKSCPGNWLFSRLGNVANTVTERLNGKSEPSKPSSPAPAKPTSKTLKKGSTGNDVKTLQKNLNTVINAKLAVDGDFGSITEAAVKNFQKKYKITVDGIYGPESEKAMKNALIKINNTSKKTSYTVKVICDALNIRSGAGTGYSIVGCIRDKGVYTIIEEKNGWGKLKSGAGWISLAYTKKQ